MEIHGELCHNTLIKNMKPKLSFDEAKDYNEWRKQVKDKFIELFGIDKIKENSCPLTYQIESVEQKEGYTQTRFVFESEKYSFVPCYLLVPNTGKEKYPLAITMQGHTSGFHNSVGIIKVKDDERWQPTHQYAIQAVKRGFAALAIEQRGMGERRPSGGTKDAANMCEYESHIALMLGRTILGERVWDISKAIDVMSNFEKIDLDKIIILGHSGGGTATYYAACYDERIKLAAPNCSACPYPESIMDIFHCSCNFVPHAYEWFDLQDLACLIAPRRLAILYGTQDFIFPPFGFERGYKTIEGIYKKANAESNCSLNPTPETHSWSEQVCWETIEREFKKI